MKIVRNKPWVLHLTILLGIHAYAQEVPPSHELIASESDWPQWRGPNRNGIAPSSPKLLDIWPKEGPKLLWKSDRIPGGRDSGAGSVVVAGGKVFVYVNWKHFASKEKIFTPQLLKDMGWIPDVPAGLTAKIEAAWRSAKCPKEPGAELDAYIKDFIATLDPKVGEMFGDWIQQRIRKRGRAIAWPTLVEYAKFLDKDPEDYRGVTRAQTIDWGTKEASNFVDPNEWKELARKFKEATTTCDAVVCLDAATGKEVWRKEFPGDYTSPEMANYAASGTPAVVGDKCYAQGSAGLYCLSVKDGSEVWKVQPGFSCSSPLVVNGSVVTLQGLPWDGKQRHGMALTAFDAQSGQLRWKSMYAGLNSSAVTWNHGGKTYLILNYCTDGHGSPSCIDPDSGKVIWESASIGSKNRPGHFSPAISGDIVALAGDAVFNLTPQNSEPIGEKRPEYHCCYSSPLIYHDCVYVTGAYVERGPICIDLKTGVKHWKGDKAIDAGSAILADDKIICNCLFDDPRNEDGALGDLAGTLMCKATPEKYVELGRFNSRAVNFASPAIAGGKLYLRCANWIACYDLAAGN